MPNWEEYKFKIDAYTPDTLPMARCASYISELAKMLGETRHVHLVGLEPGSTIILHKVDIEAASRVRHRTEAVRRGEGNVVEMDAYRRINHMLREDNATAVYAEADDTTIIEFPGTREEASALSAIQQQGKIDGEVIRVGGKGDPVPVLLHTEGKEISGCYARREIAKQLARYLFEPVRLHGTGRWDRSEEGEWTLVRFNVDRFEVLEDAHLSNTIMALRALELEWGEDAVEELLKSRGTDEDVH